MGVWVCEGGARVNGERWTGAEGESPLVLLAMMVRVVSQPSATRFRKGCASGEFAAR